jgi:parallel beta-helix repeat protein
MNKTVLFTLGCLLVFCTFSFFIPPSTGEEITSQTLYVGGDGPGNYTRIQDALDNITIGDSVYVFHGIYQENLRIMTPVHLVGEEPNSTIIDGKNETYVVSLEAGNTTLAGFTIIHSKQKFPYAGVYVISNYNTVSNTILTNNFYGMQLGYSSQHNHITNNTIFHNGRCGIYFNHASDNILRGNIVYDHPVNGFGLYEFSNNNQILQNTFTDNRDTGVNIRESYDNLIANNTFLQGRVALHTPAPEYHTIEQGNQFTDNVVSVEEERDAFVVTVIVFSASVFIVFLVFRKLLR